MRAAIFCGIQASGKTTFYAERFLETHVRISMDLLRTRHRERRLLELCLETRQPFAVDNTNPTAAERRPYVQAALAAGYEVVGYEFRTDPRAALDRNERREGRRRIPIAGLLGTHKRLEPMRPEEGYAKLFTVAIGDDGRFTVTSAMIS